MYDKNQRNFQRYEKRNDRNHPNSSGSHSEPETIKFRDEQNHLRRDLLVKDAEDWAKNKIDKTKVSYTQLRKFYGEALALKSKVKEKGFKEMEALIGMMISKAHYAMIRDKKNEGLYHFINSCITSVHTDQEYYDFVLFFEAVLGFFPRKN